MKTYKSWIVKTGVAFVSLLLALTFFSNTIYTFNLPSVTVAFAGDGVISETATGEGSAAFVETELLYANNRGKIEILVTEGDIVTAGQSLYILTTDEDELEKSRQTAQNDYDKIILRLNKLADDIALTEQRIADTQRDQEDTNDAALNEIAAYKYEIQNLEAEIAQAENALEETRILFESGVVPQNDLRTKEADLEKLKNAHAQTLEKLQNAEDAYSRSRQSAEAADEKTYNEQIETLEKSLADFSYQRQEALLDQSKAENTIRDLDEQISNGGTITVSAEKAGKVTEVVHSEQSAYIEANSLIMKIGVASAQFYSILKFPEDTGYIQPGDKLNLSIKSRQMHNIEGTVTQVFIDGGYLNARVEFTAEGLSGGEQVSAKAENVSDLYQTVLPNTSVRFDPEIGMYYFLYAEKQNSLFGFEYYARQQLIDIQTQDDKNTAFRMIAMGNAIDRPPVIINSDAAVSENDRIRVVGGSDLIEIR